MNSGKSTIEVKGSRVERVNGESKVVISDGGKRKRLRHVLTPESTRAVFSRKYWFNLYNPQI